jgi:hypothetical protein
VDTNTWGDTSSPTPNLATITTTGTWKPYTSTNPDQPFHGVAMIWLVNDGAGDLAPTCGTTLRFESLDGEVKLFTWIGDPDNDETVTLSRSPALVAAASP